MTNSETAPVERVVTGRHKIHDRELTVTGCEIAFGEVVPVPGEHDPNGPNESDAADVGLTSRRLMGERGPELSRLLGGLRIFCAADVDDLHNAVDINLPTGSVVEIDGDLTDDVALKACHDLVDRGISIAVRGVPAGDAAAELFDLASVVRIDVHGYGRDELSQFVEACEPYDVQLLATNVETMPQLHHVKRLDFDLFQGPAVQHVYAAFRAAARPTSVQHLRAAARILGADLDFDEIESLLRPEPQLAVQVMQLASLGRIGETRRHISTIRDALVSAGTSRVQHWIALLAAFPSEPDGEDRLFETLLRASACEHLAGQALGANSARMAFAAGTLSAFADLLDPRGVDISRLALSDELREASFGEQSPLARLVRDVVDYQSGTTAPRLLSGVTRRDLDSAFASAFLWAVAATASLR